ncbi:SNF2 family N-terminal domain-containing protein [Trichoderma evansii]
MELTPAPPQPPPLRTQQLPSPCQSPQSTDVYLEKLDSSDTQVDKPEHYNDSNPTSEDHDTLDPVFHLIPPVQEALSMERSLFVEENETVVEDGQVAVDNIDRAMNLDMEDSPAMNNSYIVENGYAMEGDSTIDQRRQMLDAPEAEMNNDEDTLPSVDDIFDQEMANLHLQKSGELEGDDADVAEEDEGSDYEDDSSASSDNDSEHEPSQSNRTSAPAEKTQKPRRKPAQTAREYVARLHEKEDQKTARKLKQEEKKQGAKRPRKRKLIASDMGPSKALKTANGNSYFLSNGLSSSANDVPLLPAESIKASTHADQLAQLKASIPKNCDTRRKSTQEQDLNEAIKIFGYKKVEADDGNWRLKGMKTAMRCHQITAVAWMVKRELARMGPFGGLLADAMGMGKTIMSLACIIGNPANDEHITKFCRATLVVVPSKTVALQWQAEARRHYSEPYNHMAITYDRQREDLHEACTQSLIVIVTYKELILQYPDSMTLKLLAEKYGTDDISYYRELDKIVGPLFRINWYRIILDEAHAIKNAESRTCKACCALFGKYRWALSGTPLSNSSLEMYPYMKFIQCDWTDNLKDFRSMFFGEPNAEFEALISLIMYRRTMDDSFFGRQIISLPERKETDLWITMSAEEHCVVSAVSEHYIKLQVGAESGTLSERDLKDINDAKAEDGMEEQRNNKNRRRKSTPKEGSPPKASYWLTRASQVRQRQSTSHVFFIEPFFRQNFSVEELDALRNSLTEVKNKRTILEQMQLGMKADEGISKYSKGLEILQGRDETYLGKYFNMKPLLNILGGECSTRDVTCLLCNTAKPPVDPIFSSMCPHVFCSGCLVKAFVKADGEGRRVDCPYEGCGQKLASGDDVETTQKIIKDAEEKKHREPGRDSCNASAHLDDDRNGFFIASTFREDIPILPSTKLTAAMAVVLTWMHEAPDDKILIFTQFIGTAKMLGLMLQTLNIGFVYYYGGLAQSQKTRALEAIKNKDYIKVMVSTLKSGGQSLNLTVANRVIIIDPWWNKTAEQQAFGRVVRIGQEKVTHLVNIKTEEPIDRRIYSLQTMKARDVDRTLQDDGHTPQTPSEIELQKAFLRKREEKEKKMAAKARANQKAAAKNAKKKNV